MGKVVRILDGDTIEVIEDKGVLTRVRLNGIDAPEKEQPFGQRSRQALTTLTAGKIVRVEGTKRDRYGRCLAPSGSTQVILMQHKSLMAWLGPIGTEASR